MLDAFADVETRVETRQRRLKKRESANGIVANRHLAKKAQSLPPVRANVDRRQPEILRICRLEKGRRRATSLDPLKDEWRVGVAGVERQLQAGILRRCPRGSDGDDKSQRCASHAGLFGG